MPKKDNFSRAYINGIVGAGIGSSSVGTGVGGGAGGAGAGSGAGGPGGEESFAGGGGDALAARWRKLTAHFDDFVQDVQHVLMECVKNEAERRHAFSILKINRFETGILQGILANPLSEKAEGNALNAYSLTSWLRRPRCSITNIDKSQYNNRVGKAALKKEDERPLAISLSCDVWHPMSSHRNSKTYGCRCACAVRERKLACVLTLYIFVVQCYFSHRADELYFPGSSPATPAPPPPPPPPPPAPSAPPSLPDVTDPTLTRPSTGPAPAPSLSRHVPNPAAEMSNAGSERRLNWECGEGGVGTSVGSGARGLELFREDLVSFTRYRALRPLATLSYCSDAINYSTIVSTIEFDKDEEFFAIAGVTKRIKVFEYEAVVRDAVDVHYPCAEMQCAHKVSCVTWNQYHKNVLASADYEGCVCVWDASTGQRTRALQEHDKRAWSVHFNRADVRLLASGSDDARVKLWALNAERSVATLEAKFNVCCVRFNPRSSCHLAYGSADHCVHYYDLRAPRHPLQVFRDHRKAVSYVQFVDARSLVSASTDSQLKLWRVDSPRCVRSFSGHANEKNFVGLATDGTYLACGSENNALYVYYKGLSRPLLAYRFEAVRGFLEKERRDEEPADFVSAVCWRRERPDRALLAANSQGTIKVLELV
ncbi:hypothetical protein evm_012255 [Chilo suppressalis]|nr:hypothetical protein evm_012255 [Chilo suppressalis]